MVELAATCISQQRLSLVSSLQLSRDFWDLANKGEIPGPYL